MPSELSSKSNEIWETVRTRVLTGVNDHSIPYVLAFYPTQVMAGTRKPTYLAILDRRVEVQEWAANHGIATLTIQFGATGASMSPTDKESQLAEAMWALVDLFLEDPMLEGQVNDTNIVNVIPDDSSIDEAREQRWATAQIAWEFEFLIGRVT